MSKRSEVIALLAQSEAAMTYIEIADRFDWTHHYTNVVCMQMRKAGYLVIAERTPGRFRLRSCYRPTPEGMRLLDEERVPQQDGAAVRKANRAAAMPMPPARATRAPNLWDVWQ